MSSEDQEAIRSRVADILPVNGYLFSINGVVDGDKPEDARSRGIALQQENGSVLVHCNAQSRTLEQMREYVCQVLDDAFTITDNGIDEPLVVTPKQLPTTDTQESESDATT